MLSIYQPAAQPQRKLRLSGDPLAWYRYGSDHPSLLCRPYVGFILSKFAFPLFRRWETTSTSNLNSKPRPYKRRATEQRKLADRHILGSQRGQTWQASTVSWPGGSKQSTFSVSETHVTSGMFPAVWGTCVAEHLWGHMVDWSRLVLIFFCSNHCQST